MRIVGFILVVGLALLTLLKTCPAREGNAALVPREAYVFSYFKGNGEDGLHLAYSVDGLVWQPLNCGKSFLRPTAIKVGERWIVYFDKYREHRYGGGRIGRLETMGRHLDATSISRGRSTRDSSARAARSTKPAA